MHHCGGLPALAHVAIWPPACTAGMVLQYTTPFSSVDLTKMAAAFNTSVRWAGAGGVGVCVCGWKGGVGGSRGGEADSHLFALVCNSRDIHQQQADKTCTELLPNALKLMLHVTGAAAGGPPPPPASRAGPASLPAWQKVHGRAQQPPPASPFVNEWPNAHMLVHMCAACPAKMGWSAASAG